MLWIKAAGGQGLDYLILNHDEGPQISVVRSRKAQKLQRTHITPRKSLCDKGFSGFGRVPVE